MIISPEQHISLKLITSPRVARYVGFNVYPLAVPKDAPFPFLLYRRANISRESTITSNGPIYAPVATIQIACWALDYDTARAVADEVRLALDGGTGTLANATIQDMRLVSELDDFLDPSVQGAQLPPAYEVRQAYQVRWQESVG
jgi:hypothetical protein